MVYPLEREPIAIIGMGCRFPGVTNLQSFWNLLRDGIDAITPFPPDRFDAAAFYDPRPATPGKISTCHGGFLRQIDRFDYSFFGISPREAALIDPQVRILLEVAWEALEDAGELPAKFAGSQTGVFIGQTADHYGYIQMRDPEKISLYTLTGSSRSMMSGRLSYLLDLRGPSLTVDSACSSSLVAVHLACQSIWNRESSMAFAGGVHLLLLLESSIGFSQANMLAPDGHCKAFDAQGDGFVRSEGAGVVMLKPLAQALADRNPIYALIRGSAVSNDGQSNQLLITPSQVGQELALRNAYASANVAPGQIHYVEAHGTGTSVGDPVELAALAAVLREGRAPEAICHIGSVKTNIGHTEAAAGVAGLIKTALCLKHRQLVPDLHFSTPHPAVPWYDIPLRVVEQLTPLPSDQEVIAGVSSFGISGTNAHVVLETIPHVVPQPVTKPEAVRSYLLPLSAKSESALQALAATWQQFLLEEGHAYPLAELCYTASERRTHHDYRFAAAGTSHEELAALLSSYCQDISPDRQGRPVGKRDVVFVFPGQGSQWLGMGQQLLETEPVFRAALEACAQAMRPYLDWSLLEQLMASETRSLLSEISHVQPLIFAVQVALARLWISWGIMPAAVIGHSMGEVAAAYIAGILSLADAARIICLRSQLLHQVSGQGAMAVVDLPFEQVRKVVHGKEALVTPAVINSPTSTVLSGELTALEGILADLSAQDIFCRRVNVDIASHSPQMDPLLEPLQICLRGLDPQPAHVAFYSTVTAALAEGPECGASYWAANLREPVLFAQAIGQALADNHDLFLEIGPHPLLLGAIQQCARHGQRSAITIASLQREEDERLALLTSLGRLYSCGASVAWSALFSGRERCVALPAYPWQKERCWSEPAPNIQASRTRSDGSPAHPLLRQYIQPAHLSRSHFWETELRTPTFSYLKDHRVQQHIVFPAAAYLEMACAAVQEVFLLRCPHIESLHFESALFLSEEQPRSLQTVLTARNADMATIQFFARASHSNNGQSEVALLHAQGEISLRPATEQEQDALQVFDREQIRQRCNEHVPATQHYQTMELHSLFYGPVFRGVESIWKGQGEALARICHRVPLEKHGYYFHPTLLDACFQVAAVVLVPAREEDDPTDIYLPVAVHNFTAFAPPPDECWVYAQRVDESAGGLSCALWLLDSDGRAFAHIAQLQVQRLASIQDQDETSSINDGFYQLSWEKAVDEQNNVEPSFSQSSENWLIFADAGEVGAHLASELRLHGKHCILVSPGENHQVLAHDHYQVPPLDPEAFEHLLSPSLTGIIYLWSLDQPCDGDITPQALLTAQEQVCGSVLHLVQSLARSRSAPRLFLLSRGVHRITEHDTALSSLQAPLWGLGRVIAVEHPEFRCKLVDVDAHGEAPDISLLIQELQADGPETQVALRGSQRYVARLKTFQPGSAADNQEQGPRLQEVDSEHPFSLDFSGSGLLNQMRLKECSRSAPGPDEVEIHVYSMGLNFKDVLLALGIDVGQSGQDLCIGCEYAGRIVRVGEHVTAFRVGEPVIAAFSAGVRSYVTIPQQFVVLKPDHLTFEEAATLPTAFATAYYALCQLGALAANERVLIHCGSGGVGLAAIQLAQLRGAEIFATAGTEEKRSYLRSLGVPHVMNSRTLTFVDEVLAATDGRGVDVVLNSLSGEALKRSVDLLAPYGRFLEIGKRDIYQDSQLGLGAFKQNLSFSTIALDQMMAERTPKVQTILKKITRLLVQGKIRPLPSTVFSINESVEAFQYMAQGRHIGKVVLTFHDQPVRIERNMPEPPLFKADATYLLTGGLGGLGLVVAEWMAAHGARRLALLGRSAPNEQAHQRLELLRASGVQVSGIQADITEPASLAAALRHIERTMPPLRGIMHAAAVLDDKTLLQLDWPRFSAVMAPKVAGAWHLHDQTLHLPLDFFVCFSSAAGLLGSPGQGNYCAANTFLDAFMHARHARGLPALSINWGAWARVGLAARQANRGQRIAERGMKNFSPEQGLEALEVLMRQQEPQLAFMPFDLRQWQRFYPEMGESPLFAYLYTGSGAGGEHGGSFSAILQSILTQASEQRLPAIESYLCGRVAKILGHTHVDPLVSLNRLGLDSLMGLEVRNAIKTDLGLVIPVVDFMQQKDLRQLAEYITAKLVDVSPLADAQQKDDFVVPV